MVGPGALKPKVGDGIKSRRPLSAPVYTTFIHSSLLFCVCCCTSTGVYIILGPLVRACAVYTQRVYTCCSDPPNFSATFHTPKVSDGDFT